MFFDQSIAEARARCAAKSAEIGTLATQQQALLQLHNVLVRPMVAVYFNCVLAALYAQLSVFWIAFSTLWCLRWGMILGAAGAAGLACCIAVAAIVARNEPSSSTPSSAEYSVPPAIPQSSSSVDQLSPYQPSAPYQPTTATYYDPYSSDPRLKNGSGSALSPKLGAEPKKPFWTEERKQLAEDTGIRLAEAGLRYWTGNYPGGSQGKVHVTGY
jgi:hypothetical protein